MSIFNRPRSFRNKHNSDNYGSNDSGYDNDSNPTNIRSFHNNNRYSEPKNYNKKQRYQQERSNENQFNKDFRGSKGNVAFMNRNFKHGNGQNAESSMWLGRLHTGFFAHRAQQTLKSVKNNLQEKEKTTKLTVQEKTYIDEVDSEVEWYDHKITKQYGNPDMQYYDEEWHKKIHDKRNNDNLQETLEYTVLTITNGDKNNKSNWNKQAMDNIQKSLDKKQVYDLDDKNLLTKEDEAYKLLNAYGSIIYDGDRDDQIKNMMNEDKNVISGEEINKFFKHVDIIESEFKKDNILFNKLKNNQQLYKYQLKERFYEGFNNYMKQQLIKLNILRQEEAFKYRLDSSSEDSRYKICFIPSGGSKSTLKRRFPNLFVDADDIYSIECDPGQMIKNYKSEYRLDPWTPLNAFWQSLIQKYKYLFEDKILLIHGPSCVPKSILDDSKNLFLFPLFKQDLRAQLDNISALEKYLKYDNVLDSFKVIEDNLDMFIIYIFMYFDLSVTFFQKKEYG